MTEDNAKDWIATQFGIPALSIMAQLVDLTRAATKTQNLIAPSTLSSIWTRHIVDSAQLISLAPAGDGLWLDIGSGAGFPGLVVAALTGRPVVLVEPRKRRATYLQEAVDTLGIAQSVEVHCAQAQTISVPAAVISARAVAYLGDIFEWGSGCTSSLTHWILPKGRSARDEISAAQRSWHGVFHVEHSITDPESLIVLASGVARR